MTNQYISSVVDHQRRLLLKAALAAPVLMLPSDFVQAGMLDVTRLHPTRFFAGLMLDFLQAVLVEVAANYVAGQWFNEPVSFHSSLPLSEGRNFNHVGYKVSVVRLGVVDYQEHKRRMLALQLKNAAQNQRFADLRDYLRDEKIRICLAGDEYAKTFPNSLEPDDLFTMNYLDAPAERLPIHYQNLINASGVHIFEQWYG